MSLYLEIIESPDASLVGSRVEIFDGMKIGRKGASLVINDSNISSIHAKIKQLGSDRFILTDADSRNGIHLNGKQVKKVTLMPDVLFIVGKTTLKVVRPSSDWQGVPIALHWSKRLNENLRSFLFSLVNEDGESENTGSLFPLADEKTLTPKSEKLCPYFQSLAPLPCLVKLRFLEGIQVDQEILLGYGPRRGGFRHFDIDLFEADCPNEIFEIRASTDGTGIEILIFDSDFLLLNGARLERSILKNGDRLEFGKSRMLVELVGNSVQFS